MDQVLNLDISDPKVLLAIAAVLGAIVFWFIRRKKSEQQIVSYTSIKKPIASAKAKQAEATSEEDLAKPPITFLVGSQTGTAEDYARRLQRSARRHGFRAKMVDLEDFEPEDLASEPFVIFVIATYGEGEPTDSSAQFYEWIMHDDRPDELLSKVKYAVFSLGNKTYTHYQAIGRKVDKRMAALGAKSVFQRGEGDDDGTLEEDFVAWEEKLWPALCNEFGLQYNENGDDSSAMERRFKVTFLTPGSVRIPPDRLKPSGIPDAKAPYWARVVANRELHSVGSDRSCRHVEFDIKGSGIRYQPGDHLGIYPENDPEIVEALAKRLGLELDVPFNMAALNPAETKKTPFPVPCTVRTALTRHCNITGPLNKSMILALAQYATDEKQKERLMLLGANTDQGKMEFNNYVKKGERSVIELLADFDSLKPDPGHFIELLPHMQVRYYSISSSPRLCGDIVHITAVVTRYTRPCGAELKGVCTNFLARIANQPDVRVPIFSRPSVFKLPRDPTVPIVMVGPGTGLAPFRGFIQDRQVLKTMRPIGDSILFFGCRNEQHDFIYRDELYAALENHSLTELQVAFSRQTSQRVYVQDLMRQKAELLWDILNTRKGHFYVCGDAKHMAGDVSRALLAIAQQCGHLDEKEAAAWVSNLTDEHRLNQDVW